jgi:hypothetical protein
MHLTRYPFQLSIFLANSVLLALYTAIWVHLATLRVSGQHMLLPLSGKLQKFMEWAISEKKGQFFRNRTSNVLA